VDEEQFRRFSQMPSRSDPSRLLCVGRLAPEKGQEYLLQALSILRSRGVEVHLDLVGAGPLEQHLRERVAALGLTTKVAFHGYVPYGPALFALYREAGVLVLPSLTEGLPQVIGESLSAGLPTVATSVGGIPAFLTDGETALLVPPRDPVALAAAIERVVRDERLSETLRRNGRALMCENTLEANRARIMEAIHNELCATAA
jgi:glycosyltransferase involved in cell wall biosynthesis